MTTVAITGAARGIGREIARQHLAAGDTVLALVRDPAGAGALRALAGAAGDRLVIHAMDVGDEASVRAAAAGTGDGPIDILYNVAGIAGPVPPELERSDWAAWDAAMNVMVYGPLRVLQAFLPRLPAGARVINISSQIGASTWPQGGFYAYGAAKAALNRVMRSVAIDVKDRGLVIGLVHPGWVRTDMGGPNADITPEDSARGIVALARNWTIERTGTFYKWNGEQHPW